MGRVTVHLVVQLGAVTAVFIAAALAVRITTRRDIRRRYRRLLADVRGAGQHDRAEYLERKYAGYFDLKWWQREAAWMVWEVDDDD